MRGEEGRLLYLGYDIDDLVEMCCFEEVIYLLLNKDVYKRQGEGNHKIFLCSHGVGLKDLKG